MSTTIIGVDCAVDSAKVGVAVGHYSTTHRSVEEVVVGLGKKELEHFLARVRHDAEPIGTLKDDIRSLDLATQLIHKLRPQFVH